MSEFSKGVKKYIKKILEELAIKHLGYFHMGVIPRFAFTEAI